MLDYIKFENITKKSSNAASPTLPLITISKQAIYFNVVFRRLHPNLKAVAIYYYNDQLLLSFYTDFSEENSIRLSRTDKSYSCAFMKQAEILKNRTTAEEVNKKDLKKAGSIINGKFVLDDGQIVDGVAEKPAGESIKFDL